MTASIVLFWRRLAGTVHPDDQAILDREPHSFNLDYPPPAYVGDVENAPVILLYSNGGYDPQTTPQEFASPADAARLREYLHAPTQIDPAKISPWCGHRNFAELINAGTLALINAVPYRSPLLSSEPANRRVARMLPSRLAANRWLAGEVLSRQDRLVLLHRGRPYWNLPVGPAAQVLLSPNPISSDLTKPLLEAAQSWRKPVN